MASANDAGRVLSNEVQMVKVFAYGSNMLTSRLRALAPSASVAGTGRLGGHTLRFHKRSSKDGSAKANALVDVGDDVWGVLYEISHEELVKLDAAEGLNHGYIREEREVIVSGVDVVTAHIYIASADAIDPKLKPFTWYKALVLAGAREHQLPSAYIEMLEGVEAIVDSDKRRHEQHMALVNPFQMTISLNVLNHLGLRLYSNVPAVVAEAVANAWDADARMVTITADTTQITIRDDGVGMTRSDVNTKYLTVGYDRRAEDDNGNTASGRPVMGRKGIGKLSLFSIADCIDVYTRNGDEASGLRMSRPKVESQIKNAGEGTYYPEALDTTHFQQERGTEIILRELTKRVTTASISALRKRLARRFSIIGPRHAFEVEINGEPIRVEDRGYLHKLQFVWWLGPPDEDFKSKCVNVKSEDHTFLDGTVVGPNDPPWKMTGWIGTAKLPKDLEDDGESLNKITILARGRLAQEDILADVTPSGLYTKYLIGEVTADFLDDDKLEDIATSNRQRIIEDDPRYVALRQAIRERLVQIESSWSDKRGRDGKDVALRIDALKTWFESLGGDAKKRAESLFAKINRIAVSPEHQRTLYKHGVLAFETLRQQEKLAELEKIQDTDVEGFVRIFQDLDQIEAVFYHQIVAERIKVIERLQEKVDDNALEKVLQKLLFDNLWLLDASWERATQTEYMEKTVVNALRPANDLTTLAEDERLGRVDIGYKTTAGRHVVIELKRAERSVTTSELVDQCSKYYRALRKVLTDQSEATAPIEIVVVLGKEPSDWQDSPEFREKGIATLKGSDTRVRTYHELLTTAHRAYDEYLKRKKKLGDIAALVAKIDVGD